MNYLAVRSRFAVQGLVSSHELRMAFPDFDKRRLVEWQACHCRLARSQRNHIALAVWAWTRLK